MIESESIAHVKQNSDGSWAEPHPLQLHLQSVAELAKIFADEFNSGPWGFSAGIGHDTGKGPPQWQKYLCSKSGYDENAHIEGKPGKLEHSCHGAKLAEELFGKGIGRILSYCIAGHHAGLPDLHDGGPKSLAFRLQKTTTDDISESLKELVKKSRPGSPPWLFSQKEADTLDMSLWIRMLFSSLVDADFLDTESYMDKGNSQLRGGYLSMKELLQRFNDYMESKFAQTEKTPVNTLRGEILAQCRSAAFQNPGIFSLSVPTGGGKTLSSLAFALQHAAEHSLRRVIYVIPYTSIIEQNADVFREALGDDQVIEHHSNLDDNDCTKKSRLSAENWDAPLVVTTSVQFFESLFAAKPSRCRKLHNIVGSVVVLDEAQLIPVEYLHPILQTIDLLHRHYKVTFVFSTATQPAFEARGEFKGLPQGSIREIVADIPTLYQKLKRVTVEIPNDFLKPRSWEDLAEGLSREEQVLCVVSDRRSCRELFKAMPPGTIHLSALMCGQHRSQIINEIKQKLSNHEPVRVISTQLVEAGVDFDFPVVFRAIAGLDSIAQAGGRCNREGRLPGMGRLVIFIPPRRSPPGILRKATETTISMLKTNHGDPLDHAMFEKFFLDLYWKAEKDSKGIINLLKPDMEELGIRFRTAGEQFRIIDDTMIRSVLVPYRDGDIFIKMLKSKGPERWILRKLQRYTVTVYTGDFEKMSKRGSIYEIQPGIFGLTTAIEYDDTLGLLVDEIPDNPEIFMM
ncbi:MAG: CRISPR-associated endonuclease Cas3'' [Chitinivibrionales bacterium]|nr:CRISPR-associated endonuclease Cas3'' [Chitinivibrionales bacterium]